MKYKDINACLFYCLKCLTSNQPQKRQARNLKQPWNNTQLEMQEKLQELAQR